MSRRQFLASSFASVTHAAEEGAASSNAFREPAHYLPVNNDADVIVCGAGPAGVTAARRMLDEAQAKDFGIAAQIYPGYLGKKRPELARVARQGKPYARRLASPHRELASGKTATRFVRIMPCL